jgi:hypothetical protein
MSTFRTRPLVISAEQFTSDHEPEGICRCVGRTHLGAPHLHTRAGPLAATEGDWIVTGVRGERYPIKDDLFRSTYDAVEAPSA